MGSTVKILLGLNEMFLKIVKSWTENGHINVTIIGLRILGDIFSAFMYCPYIYIIIYIYIYIYMFWNVHITSFNWKQSRHHLAKT